MLGLAGLSLGDEVGSSDIGRELGVVPLLHCIEKESVEVVLPSCQEATWAPSLWRLTGPAQLVGDLEVDPELPGWTTYPIWLGSASGSPPGLAGKLDELDVWNTLLSQLPPRPNPG